MRNDEFTVLVYKDFFVDISVLHTTLTPTYSPQLLRFGTIEQMIKQVEDGWGGFDPATARFYIDNLRRCELVKYRLERVEE